MRRTSLGSVRWVRPQEERPLSGRVSDFFSVTVARTFGLELQRVRDQLASPLRQAMLEQAPVVEHAKDAKAEARHLLQAAAEIEHALLVEYLYAAFSLKSSPIRKTLVRIAVQEMSHLLAVQNLLLFLGDDPYFERQDVSPNPDHDPFPFGLRGYSRKETLERFVLAEMPVFETLGTDDQAVIAEIRKRIDPELKFKRVGVLYGRIYWLFQESALPQGPWTDVANTADIGELPQWHLDKFDGAGTFTTKQASTTEIGKRINGSIGQIWWQNASGDGAFNTIDSRDAALKLIYDIAVQGEGLTDDNEHSHFHIFFRALKSHGEIGPDDFHPVPDNPGTASGAGQTEITDPAALALCELLNDRYRIMLVSMTAALLHDRTTEAENVQRQKLVFWAFAEMKSAIPKIVSAILARPCEAGGDPDALCAGPPFAFGDVDLTGDVKALEQENRRLHVHARQPIDALKQLGVASELVAAIEATDHERYPDT